MISSSAVRPPVLRAPDKGLASLVPSSSPASPGDPFVACFSGRPLRRRPRHPNRATPCETDPSSAARPTPRPKWDRPLVPSGTDPSSQAGPTPRPELDRPLVRSQTPPLPTEQAAAESKP
ncbi:TANK-binding kinase 1-binding protein 1-like [Dasypus novemcinctus]|uniref:TANK-binding kinase 1-binding protein 1-like n=1 Tax=Dasypus novemcinctus TaxID=9361 RepID=UPI00265E4CA8|nr:uncharacterized protein LOC131277451 [Dasypus novemcinctus]